MKQKQNILGRNTRKKKFHFTFSTKMRAYNHPILVNPTRWLRGPKKHAAALYQNGYYPSLDNNPFALALARLDANSPSSTLPIGNGIPLTVTQQDNHHVLTPTLNDTAEPSRLIVNSARYIKLIVDRPKAIQKLVPLQFIQQCKSSKAKVSMNRDMVDVIDKMYRQRIEELLEDVGNESGESGIILKPMDVPVRIEGSTTYVNNIFTTHPKFINYTHRELSQLILAYTDFVNL